MGYYTWFEMSKMENDGKYKVNDIVQYMRKEYNERGKFYPFRYGIEYFEGDESMCDFDLSCDEASKWHDHEEEMLEMSKKIPEIVFCLHGEGEASEDLWYKYFKNGKIQHCRARIEYDDYDESMLE